MQKIIILDENEDKRTHSIKLYNFEGQGSEMTIDRAIVDLKCTDACHMMTHKEMKLVLTMDCTSNYKGELYTKYIPKADVRRIDDSELLEELERRKRLIKETVYRRV